MPYAVHMCEFLGIGVKANKTLPFISNVNYC